MSKYLPISPEDMSFARVHTIGRFPGLRNPGFLPLSGTPEHRSAIKPERPQGYLYPDDTRKWP